VEDLGKGQLEGQGKGHSEGQPKVDKILKLRRVNKNLRNN